jgi:histidinol-phosphatase
MTDWDADLALAQALADRADAVTMARFQAADLVVESKPDLTPVTDADRAVEEAIRAELSRTRPDDAVVGEEFGASSGSGGAGPRRWIVDPIDGTKNYVRGVPVWATLIALEADGEVVVGVVSAPALNRRWWAGRGTGAWVATGSDVRRCRVSRVATLAEASVSYSSFTGWEPSARDRFVAMLDRVWRTRAFGDFWSHLLVAEGVVDVSCEPEVSLWDLAALQPIVEEAGGRFTDLAGAPGPQHGSCVCTNGLLHDEVLAALRS